MIPNREVLKRVQTASIEAYLIKAQLRLTGHILRMEDGRLPNDLLYGELKRGSRSIGGQRKRFKDTLRLSLSVCNIDTDKWVSTAQDRIQWISSVQDGFNMFKNERVATAGERRTTRKAIQSQQPSAPSPSISCVPCVVESAQTALD